MSASDRVTVNGIDMAVYDNHDGEQSALGRRCAAAHERGCDQIDRLSPNVRTVTVWVRPPADGEDPPCVAYEPPAGWRVASVDFVMGEAVAVDIEPEGGD